MSRIGVLLSVENQRPGDSPRHYVSKTIRTLALRDQMHGRPVAERVSDCIILIAASLTIKELKERYRVDASRPVLIPKLLPPQKIEPNLNLWYPAPWMETNGDQLQARLFMKHQPCPPSCGMCRQAKLDHQRANVNSVRFPEDEPIFWLFRNAQ